MFNLIMAYSDEDWLVPLQTAQTATFSLSRYLEYTDAELERQLKPVSDTSLAWLATHPAVFMSEIYFERGDTAGGGLVNLRVGRVFGLSIQGTDIRYSFIITRDFGAIALNDRKRFENAFAMGRMEIHRTHWAVKNGDLNTALVQAGVVAQGEFVIPPPPLFPPQPAIIDLQPEPEVPPAAVIESVQEFMDYVLNEEVGEGQEVYYRGHSDRKYRLEPSLFRKSATGEYKYLQNEAKMVLELLSAQHASFASDEYMLDRLVRMQHFGLPTRLLDVTSNPLVALYFCCSDLKVDQHGEEIDGEVIILTNDASDVKFYESDTVSCIANLAMLDEEVKKRLNTSLDLETFNTLPEAGKLLHFIRREKPYFDPRIAPKDLERIVFVKGRSTHERITSQSGAFLIFGKDSVLPETGHSSLDVKRVVVRQKQRVLDELGKLNIKSSTIYPGLEKTTAEIAKKYEFQLR